MDVDTVYSASLMVALLTAASGAFLGVLSLFSFARAPDVRQPLARAMVALLTIAACSGTTSIVVHALFGHGAGTAEPMSSGVFLVEHGAYAFVAGFILIGLTSLALRRRRD